MEEADSQLAHLCEQTVKIAREAADWIDRNKAAVGAKSAGLRREMRQQAEVARKFQRAATRPLCIGIFGPSQVGKSYLVSALARKGTNPLIVLLDEERDFLQINPEKEQEATGLVTRFSIHPTSAPPSHPVAVRLLSQTDLVKILANTYFLDFKATEEREPPEETLSQALAEAQKRAQPTAVDPLDDVQIEELRRYCDEQFAARRTTEVLRRAGFWAQLEDIAPRLALQDRVKLYSFLWGRLPEFTNLYVALYQCLQGLGFAEEAYCPIEALLPRDDSILDVNTLKGLGNPQGPPIEVLGKATNRRHLIPRPYLTAIVAELLIQIKEQPRDYFSYTDILDFPGARSRKQYEDLENFVKKEDSLPELFRRGKVAYLFDHYCDEREITGMLLCMVPGNQEVHSLPEMVLNWIHRSHGATATERRAVATALFLVLTKFDRRFEKSKGKPMSSEERWTSAIETALTGFYGKGRDNWPEQWHPNQSFNNSFWLRNPNFVAEGLMAYAGDGDERKEIGLQNPASIASFKQEYLSNRMIRLHFADPEKAWEAAFSLNDGGVTYLADALSPVCKPELKRSQIQARIDELRSGLLTMLREFAVSDDRSAERKKRIEAAQIAVTSLLDHVVDAHHLGHLIAELQVSSDDIQFLFQRSRLSNERRPVDLPVPERTTIAQRLRLPITATETSARDRYSDLADAAMEHWADRLQALPREARLLDFLKIEAETVETLVRELLAGSEIKRLGDTIAREIRVSMPAVDTGAKEMLKPAMAAAERINRYVWKLGQDALPANKRATTENDGRMQPVFPDGKRIDHLEGLSEDRDLYYQSFIVDWLASFIDLADKNASGEVKQKFSDAESARLKGILQQLGV
jgi:hypothetical protein